MKRSVLKLTWRSIRTFFGRYMALLLIVALSAGFFAGLKITQDAMVHTGDKFLSEQNFYDFQLLSTLGFTGEDVERVSELSGVEAAEGSYSLDAMVACDGSDRPVKLLALPEEVNLPRLVAGRMPAAENECLADDERFGEDDLGTTIRIAEENDESVTAQLAGEEYTIVGIVDSPLYLNLERGTTGIGSGSLYTFFYLPKENFTSEVYTEVNVTLLETAEIYSEEYDELIEDHKEEITQLCSQLADERYETLLADKGLTAELAAQFGINEPETYVLTRDENAGYVSFENDTAIISGIANIFPVFFILIAILVCITTMTRMVDEERTQIGVLKAMGFGSGAIMAKYLLYAGSATLIGWAAGFFLCTWGLPKVFWFAYSSLYDFAPLSYLFSPELAVLTLAVSLIGILGSTFISCRKELSSVPAELIRPRAAKSGKRILLEHITPLWKRLSFLQKITLRNMFRYKRRLVMMLVGISCCAGLVVTAFGVRDSMIDVGELQFESVQKYDMEADFEEGTADAVCAQLDELEAVSSYRTVATHRVDVTGAETLHSVSMMCFRDTDRLADYWDFRSGEETLAYPGRGEALVNTKIAQKLDVSVGDTIEIRDADMRTCTVTVSGIFDNYIYNFVIVSEETYADAFGEWEANAALLCVEGDAEETAKLLTKIDEVTSVSRLATTKENVDNALSCLDYIIWLIVLFSGALAFIVIFNLTNINLAERSREIATVEVLGFYPKETDSYVLRENLVLSILASLIGLPLGTLFHRVVMSQIVIDLFVFDIHVKPISYVMALICTVLFAVIVNLFMRRQIEKIPMAESLKAVE
ncbi:MAG: ABC transporter permease [Oscillospiraceae bacterium]